MVENPIRTAEKTKIPPEGQARWLPSFIEPSSTSGFMKPMTPDNALRELKEFMTEIDQQGGRITGIVNVTVDVRGKVRAHGVGDTVTRQAAIVYPK